MIICNLVLYGFFQIEEKHEILVEKFLEVLSEDIDANKKHLLTPYEKDLPNMNPCYLKTFRQFQDYCLQYYDKVSLVFIMINFYKYFF